MPGPPTEEKEGEGARGAKRARVEPEQELSCEPPLPQCRRHVDQSRYPCVAIRCDSVEFDFNSDLSGSLINQWGEAYVQWEYRAAEFSPSLVRQRCEIVRTVTVL